MSQGLFTAVSGIKACQSKIDIISDNIANMNTVGFKASKLNFENIFSNTLSSGSAPSGAVGGTNPVQIGLGVVVGEIGRNFTGGSIMSTGRGSDLNIQQGSGFFVLLDSNNTPMLSRAGNFSTDSVGNLINPKGMKVLGTDQVKGANEDKITVKIPKELYLNVDSSVATGANDISKISNNIGTNITAGTFTLGVTGGSDPGNKTVTIASGDTVDDVLTKIETAIGTGSSATIDASGKITITPASGTSVDTAGSVNDTSNFLSISGFSGNTSNALSYNTVSISSTGNAAAKNSMSTFAVSKTGAIEATYTNGDKITVVPDPANPDKLQLQYKTATGKTINYSNITVDSDNTIQAANLQLQLATVVNPKGLVSQGGNMFSVGPNSGDPTYGIAGAGMGVIDSGALESSNVDLPTEFADMILAQRGIDANSRTFEAQNQIMRTIVSLGR